MSDNIPLEIQMDIIQRFPDTKSLIRCRSVSKAWKSVIDSKDFVAAHTLRHQAHNQHLLIRTETRCDVYFPIDENRPEVKYLSIADDETVPPQNHVVFVPDSVKKFHSVIGTAYGLFALFLSKPDTVVIWNPFIRKTVEIPVPCEKHNVFGFGVCPRNLDPKLVKITFDSQLQDGSTGTQVEVFSLSSGGTWRSPLSSNVPHRSIRFGGWPGHAVVDRFNYWIAYDSINVDDGPRDHILIMSFDLTSEEFVNVNLPDPLIHSEADLAILNLKGSLAVIEFEQTEVIHVWQMIGHGCTRSFNKLYSINGGDESIHTIYVFRKSGAPIVDYNEESDHPVRGLATYEPESKSITNMGIQLLNGNSSVHSYMETLLLVAH
uniref:F-box protein At4g22390-like n=1 Tax=Erigeron canadensis TaxID=72917 RepID=UPI001CB90229|nr:F-box protein At4g22390-like [Erigeron canadensis]